MGAIDIVIILVLVAALAVCAYDGFKDGDYREGIISILMVILIIVFVVFMVGSKGVI